MTLQDILKINIPDNFGPDNEDECCTFEEIFDCLDDSVETCYGASKFVIFLNENTVVKIPFNGMYFYNYNEDTQCYDDNPEFRPFQYKDYCNIEAEIYESAEENNVECCFAKTEYAGSTSNSTPIYISERVKGYTDYDVIEKINPSSDSRKKASKKCRKAGLPETWLALAYDYYGDVIVNKLIDFIEKERISDLHSGNLGIRNDGSPVILDYSSFLEDF